MIFGIGDKQNKAADQSTLEANISPEAAALLKEMTRGNTPMTGQNNASEQDVPFAAHEPATSGGASADIEPETSPEPDEIGGDKLRFGRTRREKLTPAEKQRAAHQSKEEKARASRRRKLSKSRFSRTKYLREANGNGIPSLIALGFLFCFVLLGPMILNTAYLNPRTKENLDTIARIDGLRATIQSAKSSIEATAAQTVQMEQDIGMRVAQFADATTVRTTLLGFIAGLERRGVLIKTETSRNIFTEELQITGLASQRMNLSLQANFLDYLSVRNKFVREQPRISITEEVITAKQGNPIVDIRLSLSIPSTS
jgi:hypothetical protein